MRYISTNHWKAENNVWKFNFVPEGIQLANLGASHGEVGFIYDDFPQYKTFNFALSAQWYFWDYGILQQYIDNFAPGAVVLLLVSYFGITAHPDDYNEFHPRYYRFVKKEYFDEWNGGEFIQYAKFPILSAGNNLFKCIKDIPESNIDKIRDRTYILELEELEKYSQARYKQWTTEDEKGEVGYQQNLTEVCQLVKFCLDNGLKPVLVTTPVTSVLNDIYAEDENFFKTFYRFIADIQAQFPEVQYFDYSHDSDFSPQLKLFGDGDHLNIYGAKTFTARVVADLQEAELLK